MATQTTDRAADLRQLDIPRSWSGIRPAFPLAWMALFAAGAAAVPAFLRGDLEVEIITMCAGVWAFLLGRWLARDTPQAAGAFTVAALVMSVAASLTSHLDLTWIVGIASAVAAAAGSLVLHRRRRLARALVWLARGLAQKTSDSRPISQILTPRWWTAKASTGLPVVWNYPDGLTPDEKQLAALEAVATARTGALTAIDFRPVQALLTEAVVPPPAPEPEPQDPEEQRLQASVSGLVPHISINRLHYDGSGKFAELAISWPPEANRRMASPAFRQRVVRHLYEVIKPTRGGDPAEPRSAITAFWDMPNDAGVLRPVPKLDTRIPHPARGEEEQRDPWKCRFGQFRDSSKCAWDMDDTLPHVLIVGGTGGGKTTLLMTLLTSVPQTDEITTSLFAIDPKRLGLRNFHLLPGSEGRRAATDAPAFVDTLERVWALMDRRFDDVDDEVVDRDDLDPIVLVIDEGEEMASILNAWWKSGEGKADWKRRMEEAGTPITGSLTGSEHPAMNILSSILRLGREVRVHVILASQSVLAKWLGTNLRGQFAVRISLRNLSASDSNVVFGTTAAASGLEPHAGRAWVQIGTGMALQDAQIYWTPTIKKNLKPEDRQILRGRGVTPPDELDDAATAPETAVAVLDRPEEIGADDDVEVPEIPDTVAEMLADDDPPLPPSNPPQNEAFERGEAEADGSAGDEPVPTGHASVVDLADGDRILVEDENGTPQVAVVRDVVADPADPDFLAVEYELVDSGEEGVLSLSDDETVPTVE